MNRRYQANAPKKTAKYRKLIPYRTNSRSILCFQGGFARVALVLSVRCAIPNCQPATQTQPVNGGRASISRRGQRRPSCPGNPIAEIVSLFAKNQTVA